MQKKDLLQRDRFINHIEKYIELFLQDDSKNAVIAIDGKWGCGKTFVVKKLIENIDALKYKSEVEQNRRYLVSYYNSWKYDYYLCCILLCIRVIIINSTRKRNRT